MKLMKALVTVILIMGILVATVGCMGSGTQSLQGILEQIDTVNGQITVVTKDGQTRVVTIDSKTQVTIDGQTVAVEALDPGTHIEIELEDDSPNTAGVVEARLAKIEGAVVQFQNGELTIAPEHGGDQARVNIDNSTQIKLEDDRTGTTADLKTGARVEVKYDPETDIALKVHVDSEEEADTEGTVTLVSGNQVTVQGERERTLTLTVDNTTMIEHGTMADIRAGVKVEVKFDPVSLIAHKVELKDGESISEEKNYAAHLSGSEEVPSVTTQAQGQAIFHLSDDGEGLEFKLIVANTSNITMSHIHLAPKGQNGQPVAWLYPSTQAPQLIEGAFSGTLSEGKITAANLVGPLAGQPLSALIQGMNAGETYVNVHTQRYPNGEIRGQISFGKVEDSEEDGQDEGRLEDEEDSQDKGRLEDEEDSQDKGRLEDEEDSEEEGRLEDREEVSEDEGRVEDEEEGSEDEGRLEDREEVSEDEGRVEDDEEDQEMVKKATYSLKDDFLLFAQV